MKAFSICSSPRSDSENSCFLDELARRTKLGRGPKEVKTIRFINRLLAPALICLGAALLSTRAQSTNDGQADNGASRQITLDRFNKARPPTSSDATTNAGSGSSGVGTARHRIQPGRKQAPASKARLPLYRLAVAPARPAKSSADGTQNTADIGVTIWRLRPSRPADKGARVLMLDGLKQAEWTPERIEADTPLRIGDRVRLSIESPTPGYLYIIDREQYADGTMGDALLIFPTLRTRGGDNRVEPGKLIDIPAQEDQYSYFTAQPGGDRRDQIAEVITIVVLSQPLNLQIADQPLKISRKEIAGWEKLWGGVAERFELVGGAGQTWTIEEKEAGAAKGRQLTQSGPPPQSVYRVAARANGALLVTVPLRYGK
jgi:hypothetical protein